MITNTLIITTSGIYILAISPSPLGWGKFLSKLENREGKRGGEKKREKSDKTHVKITL